MLKITSRLVTEEAAKRNIPVHILDEERAIYTLTIREKTVLVKGVITTYTSGLGLKFANNKYLTSMIASSLNIMQPDTLLLIDDMSEALDFLRTHHRVVVKPLDSAHGNGVTTNVDSRDKLMDAIVLAQQFSKRVLVQAYVVGEDLRLLVIDGKLIAASRRNPASVVGDGCHTIKELIDIDNMSGRRGEGYELPLNVISVEQANLYLGDALNTVPRNSEVIQVVGTANIGTGGTADDVTDTVPQVLVDDSLKIMNALGLKTGGVDFIVSEDKAFLIEINANPSFGLHVYPASGKPRQVASAYVDWIEKEVGNTL